MIEWIEISHDDWKAEPEPGTLLRVEKMNSRWYWIGVTINEKQYHGGADEPIPDTESKAKKAAELIYQKAKDEKRENKIP